VPPVGRHLDVANDDPRIAPKLATDLVEIDPATPVGDVDARCHLS
jgi:hypothetical protein